MLAVALGTFALATLLRRHGRAAWYALIFALYPGVYVAVLRDLSEALAYRSPPAQSPTPVGPEGSWAVSRPCPWAPPR